MTINSRALALLSAFLIVGCVDTGPKPCTDCSGECVDIQNDRRHCGACGTACAAGSVCTAGACVASCATGQTSCSGACVDTKSNPAHCGGCGVTCASNEACVMGQCATVGGADGGSCAAPLTSCSGVCFDLRNDPGHCGDCATTCATGEFCNQRTCQPIVPDAGPPPCPTGTTGCDGGGCFDQQNDPRNCGACGRTCNPTEYCSNGACLQFPVMGLDAGTCLASANPCEVVSATDAGCVVSTRACPAPGACQTGGTCNPASGACEYANRTGSCDDQNACTQTDVCVNGSCVGSDPVSCVTPTACFETSVCLPADGGCTSTLKAEGASCDDGDPCSGTDTCVVGRCVGSIRRALFDDFSVGTAPNGSKWRTTTLDAGVAVRNGELSLSRTGQLITQDEYRPTATGALRITGEVSLGATDWLRVNTRSSGGAAPFDGVEFLVKGGSANALEIRVAGTPSASVPFTPSGKTVFEIFDNGSKVVLAARGKGRGNHTIVTATIPAATTRGKIVFSDGDDLGNAASLTLDLIRIEHGLRTTPTREWTFEELTVDGGIVGGFGVLPDGGSSGDRSARFVTASPSLGSTLGNVTSPIVAAGSFGAAAVATPATGGHFPEFPANTIGASGGDYSISFWFAGTVPTRVDLFGNRVDGSQGNQNYLSIRTNPSRDTSLEYSTLSVPTNYVGLVARPATVLGDGDWHHVSVTRSNRVSSLYIDGELAESVDAGQVNNFANPNSYWMGRGYTNAGAPMAFDELRVYEDVALDACEVRQLASSADRSPFCSAGRTPCATATGGVDCSDLQTDGTNCGACGNVCPTAPNTAGSACFAGSCTFTACNVGFFDCNGLAADGCECSATLISVAMDGGAANGASGNATVDNSGQLVAFASNATNLVPNDTNNQPDCFLRNLRTNTTTRLSLDSAGNQIPQGTSGSGASFPFGCALSADGRIAAFTTMGLALPGDNNFGVDVIVVDLATNTRSYGMLSASGGQPQGNTEAFVGPFLSSDGRQVMWSTRATGLFPGDGVNGEADVLVYDRLTPSTRMASLTATGAVLPQQSGSNGSNVSSNSWTSNGRFVAFSTNAYIFGAAPPAENCGHSYLVDMATNPPTPVRLIADATTRFTCPGTTLPTATGLFSNLIGTFFVFTTKATLPNPTVSGFEKVYVRSGALNGPSTLISVSNGTNVAANGPSFSTFVSDDGSVVSLISDASDLVPNDANAGVRDCFVWRPGPTSRGRMAIMSQPATRNTAATLACETISTSRDGRWAVLEMNDAMSTVDTNNATDIYLRPVP